MKRTLQSIEKICKQLFMIIIAILIFSFLNNFITPYISIIIFSVFTFIIAYFKKFSCFFHKSNEQKLFRYLFRSIGVILTLTMFITGINDFVFQNYKDIKDKSLFGFLKFQMKMHKTEPIKIKSINEKYKVKYLFLLDKTGSVDEQKEFPISCTDMKKNFYNNLVGDLNLPGEIKEKLSKDTKFEDLLTLNLLNNIYKFDSIETKEIAIGNYYGTNNFNWLNDSNFNFWHKISKNDGIGNLFTSYLNMSVKKKKHHYSSFNEIYTEISKKIFNIDTSYSIQLFIMSDFVHDNDSFELTKRNIDLCVNKLNLNFRNLTYQITHLQLPTKQKMSQSQINGFNLLKETHNEKKTKSRFCNFSEEKFYSLPDSLILKFTNSLVQVQGFVDTIYITEKNINEQIFKNNINEHNSFLQLENNGNILSFSDELNYSSSCDVVEICPKNKALKYVYNIKVANNTMGLTFINLILGLIVMLVLSFLSLLICYLYQISNNEKVKDNLVESHQVKLFIIIYLWLSFGFMSSHFFSFKNQLDNISFIYESLENSIIGLLLLFSIFIFLVLPIFFYINECNSDINKSKNEG